MKKPSTSAQAIADQFKVTELEPRLENVWGVPEPVEQQHPDGWVDKV